MRGDGSIYQRGDIWWMKFYRDGRPVSMSCGTTSKDAAKTKLRNELRKSDEEFTEPRFKRVTVGELMKVYFDHLEAEGKDDYRKSSAARWNNHMKPTFDTMKVARFNSEAQHAYRLKRSKEGHSSTTINREFQILVSAFQLGYEMEPPLVKRMPKFHLVTENNARRVFATAAEMNAIRAQAVNPQHFSDIRAAGTLHTRAFVEIALMFGWRFSEVLELKVSNIHLAENTVRLEDSKNTDAREVSMTQTIRTLVEALVIGKQPNERVFDFSETTMRKIWNRIVKAAGCAHLHVHDLRRTSARVKRAAGVDTSIIMNMQGWRSDAMFRRYGIVAKDDIVDALDKQEKYEEQLQNGYNGRLTN